VPDLPRTQGEDQALRLRHATRVRRVRLHAVAWLVGSALITALWVWNQWDANGAFEHFGSHAGRRGDWNPTLWALGVGIWGLAVGIMALRVRLERPGVAGRIRFHVAAWTLGMVVLTPLWALLEWQDNGGFERWSGNGRPGDWEPWILYVAGFWALGIALLALSLRPRPPATGRKAGGARRPRLHV
jgi:hypothetical protein